MWRRAPAMTNPPADQEPPNLIVDVKHKKEYRRGRFLGKIYTELDIQKSLRHPHILRLISYSEEEDFVYVMLEYCSNQSLQELPERRKQLTEPETRNFMRQILRACGYLAEKKVIHRDIKPANLLLNERMDLKVADFGLTVRMAYDGQKRNVAGKDFWRDVVKCTAQLNYSFEVDVWSIGCVLYTLLVGRPPFYSKSPKTTRFRIEGSQYTVSFNMSRSDRNLIRRILNIDPQKRPCIESIAHDEFMIGGVMPSSLPPMCLTMAPSVDSANSTRTVERRKIEGCMTQLGGAQKAAAGSKTGKESQREAHLKKLQRLLQRLLSAKPAERDFQRLNELEDPALLPVIWLTKWVDYTDVYGLGYELCDSSVVVNFNDNTRIILLKNKQTVIYTDSKNTEGCHSLKEHPPSIEHKVTLLKYFRTYMNDYLVTTGEDVRQRESEHLVRLPYVETWMRTQSALCFYLTNGTVQINFLRDHTKLILCPITSAVSFVDSKRVFHTYRLQTLHTGCPHILLSRLKYAHAVLGKMAEKPSSSNQ